nr:immunoglobulin heavy chain junction region [Mus musculus]MBK4185334.1 immunoglobulin heavy chain junction region [Mus musculus]MBK4185344.1 immunoglobulin heavy chain junction region [Mus musculus]MBK4185345.1 immunoglobulin heavy chain junction region [Mus musculus]MBK4185346.1 immunoglobulin heavy chain junction region [Mus musculus]
CARDYGSSYYYAMDYW